jgi:hypothetical protein
MSRKDFERLCSELHNTRHKDHPSEYDTLSQEEKEALQYWIEHAIQPAPKVDARHSSYGLKHDYERETKVYVSHAQFKGAMLIAGYQPIEKSEQSWHFHIQPTCDERRFSPEAARHNKGASLPTYRSTPQGEQDPHLHSLVQRVLASRRGGDTSAVMMEYLVISHPITRFRRAFFAIACAFLGWNMTSFLHRKRIVTLACRSSGSSHQA